MRRTKGKGSGAIGIVGLGLIGGSLAKALHARNPKRPILGVESSARTRALMDRDGIFEAIFARPSADLSRCKIVVLCAPVPAILRLLGPVSHHMRDGAVLTDVGGSKERILAEARRSIRREISFVGAHPMFGGERQGYAAAHEDLWKKGAVAVCTDGASPATVGAVAGLHRSLGARVVLCSAAEHDAAVAAVSHLPYLVASALTLTAQGAGSLARRLAGKGFADATRPAAFSYGIQGEAARANRHLSGAARSFQAALGRLLEALDAFPADARRLFARSRLARRLSE